MRIRTVKSKTGTISVQVVDYRDGERKFIKHIGSARGSEEIETLKRVAQKWIADYLGQESLFSDDSSSNSKKFLLRNFKNLGVRYNFFAEEINKVFGHLGLDGVPSPLLLDLALVRIFEPTSKRQSQKLLEKCFGRSYQITDLYKKLPGLTEFKDLVEEKLVSFAKAQLGFNFSFVLYDVTTLYFESFSPDDFRKTGFSKDNKANQPQIVIGLMVDNNGFPLSYSIFEGNKFEGKTFLPVIRAFQKKYAVKTLTVVADAAMISWDNVQKLKEFGLSYIVGARLGSLGQSLITKVSQELNIQDKANLRLETDKGFLICDFSQKRYDKDKWEMEKQVDKATQVLNTGKALKRLKFLTAASKTESVLNQNLIDKAKLQLGIKGYYTNLDLPNQTIVDRYHDLWKVEKSFRISKSDLLMRPIFHFKKQAIEAHILICVMALAVLKFVEMETNVSARSLVGMLTEVTDTVIYHPKTGEEFFWRSEIPEGTIIWLSKLWRPH